MEITVTDFKAHCTGYLRSLAKSHEDIIITKRGKAVAIVKEAIAETDKNPLYGCLKGSVLHIADDFDQPLGEIDWDAAK